LLVVANALMQVHPTDWRKLMEATRDVARKLAEAGVIEITQKGEVSVH
jgi:dTDP-4-dehydrorhamnose reductase